MLSIVVLNVCIVDGKVADNSVVIMVDLVPSSSSSGSYFPERS